MRNVNFVMKFFVVLLLFSCSSLEKSQIVEKRRYRSGYHLDLSLFKKKREKIETTVIETKEIVSNDLASENIDRVDNLICSVDSSIDFKRKDSIFVTTKIASENCDVMLLKSGEEIKCKVLEITTSEVKYKLCEDEAGPLRSIEKSKVFRITYTNGTKEIFKDDSNLGQNGNGGVRTSGLAVASLVLGILSFFMPMAFSIIGLILGGAAANKIRSNPTSYASSSMGMAKAGSVLSAITLFLWIIIIALLVVG